MAENTLNGGVRLKEGHDQRLFPVLQQSGKPYQEHHPEGDRWLQSMWKEGQCYTLHANSTSIWTGRPHWSLIV